MDYLGVYRCVIVLSIIFGEIAGRCRFSEEWQGRWYQSGLGDVVIKEKAIVGKGVCLQNNGDYYLFQNSHQSCYSCMLLMKRHVNIIQYKESYCIDGDNQDEICSTIRPEGILYTLVREPAIPEPCPFKKGYHHYFNNNTGGTCHGLRNYAQECASESKFRFTFDECPECAYTYVQTVDFECMATWKVGSNRFMYGGFGATGMVSKNDIYRCFMYQIYGTVVYLSMSADATCRGLRSPSDGPLVMELTEDQFGWPSNSCEFPRWLTRRKWQDLSGHRTYSSDPTDRVLTASYQSSSHSHQHVRHKYRCVAKDQELTNDHQFVGISYTSDDCDAHFECIKFIKRHGQVIEIYKGAEVPHEDVQCSEAHFRSSSVHVLIPHQLPSSPCPFSGQFYVTPEVSNCVMNVKSGCRSKSNIEVTSTCLATPIQQLECVLTWREYDTQYIIARNPRSRLPAANCFSVRSSYGIMEFQTDQLCNRGAPNIFDNELHYTMDAEPASCDENRGGLPSYKEEEKPMSQQDHSIYNTGGVGGYKHTGEVMDSQGNAIVDETNHQLPTPYYSYSGALSLNQGLSCLNFVLCLCTWTLLSAFLITR